MERNVKPDLKLIIAHNTPEDQAGTDGLKSKEELHQLPLFGLSVGSFLQVIAMEQQTCILEVYRSIDDWGSFCFIKGSLYNAFYGPLEGEEAAMKMILWENVRLNIKKIGNSNDIPRKITKNLMLLLMESARLRDEALSDSEDDEDIEETESAAPDPECLKIEQSLQVLINDMGPALLTAYVSKLKEPLAIAAYNATPQVKKIFDSLTVYLNNILTNNLKMGGLGDFFIIDLKDDKTMIVLILEGYKWGIVFDSTRCTLGLFRNVMVPKIVEHLTRNRRDPFGSTELPPGTM